MYCFSACFVPEIQDDILECDLSDAETLSSDGESDLDSGSDAGDGDHSDSSSSSAHNESDTDSDASGPNQRFLSLQSSPFSSPSTRSNQRRSEARVNRTRIKGVDGDIQSSIVNTSIESGVVHRKDEQCAANTVTPGFDHQSRTQMASISCQVPPTCHMTTQQWSSGESTHDPESSSDDSQDVASSDDSVISETDRNISDHSRETSSIRKGSKSTSQSTHTDGDVPHHKISIVKCPVHVRKSSHGISDLNKSMTSGMSTDSSTVNTDSDVTSRKPESSKRIPSVPHATGDCDIINLDDPTTWCLERLQAQSSGSYKTHNIPPAHHVKPVKRIRPITLSNNDHNVSQAFREPRQSQPGACSNIPDGHGTLHKTVSPFVVPAIHGRKVFQSQLVKDRQCQSVCPQLKTSQSVIHRLDNQRKSCSVIPKMKPTSRNVYPLSDKELTDLLTSPVSTNIPGLPPLDIENDLQLLYSKSLGELRRLSAKSMNTADQTVVKSVKQSQSMTTVQKTPTKSDTAAKQNNPKSVKQTALKTMACARNSPAKSVTVPKRTPAKSVPSVEQTSTKSVTTPKPVSKKLKKSLKPNVYSCAVSGKPLSANFSESNVQNCVLIDAEPLSSDAKRDSKLVSSSQSCSKAFKNLKQFAKTVPLLNPIDHIVSEQESSCITTKRSVTPNHNRIEAFKQLKKSTGTFSSPTIQRPTSVTNLRSNTPKVSTSASLGTPGTSKLAELMDKTLKMSTPCQSQCKVAQTMTAPMQRSDGTNQQTCFLLNSFDKVQSMSKSKSSPNLVNISIDVRQLGSRKKLIMTDFEPSTNSSQSAVDTDYTSSGILGDIDSEQSETLEGTSQSELSLLTMMNTFSDSDLSDEETVIHVLTPPRPIKKPGSDTTKEPIQLKTPSSVALLKKESYVSPSVLFSRLKLKSPSATCCDKVTTNVMQTIPSSSREKSACSSGSNKCKSTDVGRHMRQKISTSYGPVKASNSMTSCHFVKQHSDGKNHSSVNLLPVSSPQQINDGEQNNAVLLKSPRRDVLVKHMMNRSETKKHSVRIPNVCISSPIIKKRSGEEVRVTDQKLDVPRSDTGQHQVASSVGQYHKESVNTSLKNIRSSHSVNTEPLCRSLTKPSSKPSGKGQIKAQKNSKVKATSLEMKCPSTVPTRSIPKCDNVVKLCKSPAAITSTPNKRGKMRSFEISSISMIEALVCKETNEKDGEPYGGLTSPSHEGHHTPNRFFRTRDGVGSPLHENCSSDLNSNKCKPDQPDRRTVHGSPDHMFGFSALNKLSPDANLMTSVSPTHHKPDKLIAADASDSGFPGSSLPKRKDEDVYAFSESDHEYPYSFEDSEQSVVSKSPAKQQRRKESQIIPRKHHRQGQPSKSWFHKISPQLKDEFEKVFNTSTKRKRLPSDENVSESNIFSTHSNKKQRHQKRSKDATPRKCLVPKKLNTSLGTSLATNLSDLCPGADLCTKSYCFSCIQ